MATKKLAKELGLLRQRSQSSNGLKKSLVSNQIFSYLIVIDFESTCWREKNNYWQEIIEFPAVLLNTSTGEVESEFHTYVQPQEHPILSEFCTELTGITQMQVEAGIPLQICLSQFNRWLQNLQLSMGVVFPNRQQISSAPSASQKQCTFLTWSDWDLGVCLQYECKRKQLHKPDVLNSWIDLRSTYRLFYDRKPKGLNGALQDLGIQFAGREHSGLDDSRNTAQLAARMMRDGCVLKITRCLVRVHDRICSDHFTKADFNLTEQTICLLDDVEPSVFDLPDHLQKMPLMVKPICGNMTEHNRADKSNTHKEENQLGTNKPSLSKNSPKSCLIKSCSEVIMSHLDTKENTRSVEKSVQICQSLISSKTLLNGATTLWRSASAEAVTNTSSLVVRNVPSPHSSSNSLVLCSTTVGCISNEPHQTLLSLPSITGDTVRLVEEEEGAEHFLMEPEDRCDSYDNVVLEADDDVISEKEREFDTDYVSEFDSGCHVWKGPETHLSGNRVILRECVRQNMSNENNFKTQKMTNEESMKSTNNMRSQVNVSNRLNKIRQHSMISEPGNYFAAPKTVTLDSNQHKSVLKTCLQVQRLSNGPHKNGKTNTPFPLRHKPFMPEKTSTPNSSFARPKPVVRQHTNHKETPKVSFTVYTDPTKSSCSSSSSSFCISKHVLSSWPTNTLSSRTNCSSNYVSVRGGQRITSPLCACGRRAKRQVVSNGGPNNGRGFYCCPVRRSGSGGRIQKGCEFFKWESALMKRSSVACPAVGSSVSLSQINLTQSCCPPQRSTVIKSC